MKKILFGFLVLSGGIASANNSCDTMNIEINTLVVNDCCENAELLQDFLTDVLGVSQEAANKAQVLYYDECVQGLQD
jgi:hypothetical protein